jgi:hypothetical protein
MVDRHLVGFFLCWTDPGDSLSMLIAGATVAVLDEGLEEDHTGPAHGVDGHRRVVVGGGYVDDHAGALAAREVEAAPAHVGEWTPLLMMRTTMAAVGVLEGDEMMVVVEAVAADGSQRGGDAAGEWDVVVADQVCREDQDQLEEEEEDEDPSCGAAGRGDVTADMHPTTWDDVWRKQRKGVEVRLGEGLGV